MLVGAFVIVAVLAPWIAAGRPWAPVGHDPDRVRLEAALEAPSSRHWLGTDSLGRDVAARMVHGTRVSVAVGLLSALLAVAIGVPLGTWAGYRRGWADVVVSRSIEAVLCFPTLVLLLALLAARPPWLEAMGDVARISIVLGAVGWVPVARYTRGEVLRVVGSDVVAAARAVGASPARILWRHVLPASLAPVLVTAAFAVAGAVGVEASLSFLGLGVRPPTPSWGGLLAEARQHVTTAWWMVAFPGAALFGLLLGCTLLAEGIRDALDPRSRRR